MEPSAWHLWVLAGLVSGGLELKLGNFVMLWFGVGALATAAAAGLGLPLNGQLLLFTASSVGLFALSRTIFRSIFMRGARSLRHGAEAMLGASALVVEELPATGTGTVRINGELWSARSLDGAMAAGETVQVESLDGLKLNVRRPREPLARATNP
jgi:membrane protein implicated in regulation of membrane protease activity